MFASMNSGRIIDINEPEYKGKRALAAEAYRKGHWIFNSREQKWYTPEEFMESKRKLGLDIRDCQVCDPRIGLRSMLAVLDGRLDDLRSMINKIENYYTMVPRRGDK